MNQPTVQIVHNAITAKLLCENREVQLYVAKLMSYAVSGAEHSKAVKSHAWDGRSSFFSMRDQTFPAGFVNMVRDSLTKLGINCAVRAKPLPEPLGPEDFWNADGIGNSDERYDYQPETIHRLLKHGRGIAQIATGGGKSRICRLAYARINRPTLFLTTRSVLMYQMKKNFEDTFKEEVAVLGDGEFGIEYAKTDGTKGRRLTKFTVAMIQTLASRLEMPAEIGARERRRANEVLNKAAEKARKMTAEAAAKYIEQAKRQSEEIIASIPAKEEAQRRRREATIQILSRFEFVVLEEAHEASGNSYYEICQHCTNAHYRLALTATPFMKGDEEANMRLMAVSGQVFIKVSEKLLIDRGILARPYFKFIRLLEKPKGLNRTTAWQKAYKMGVTENPHRNKAIIREAYKAASIGLPVMILVQAKVHGALLDDTLKKLGIRSSYIFGDSSQEERERELGKLKSGETQVLIGSTILDVGVDVPAVGMVILAGGGKAEVALRQRIGRGLRAKKDMPNVCLVVDFDDHHNNHLYDHAMTRQYHIRNTPGFAEGVLAAGGEFDYLGLGLIKSAA
ncbi:DEAD/DEAH box helicase family protein [Chitinibacter tainanensis]|uniref:DEAD/DEAH box helicase family protein n=1 Tax=Chitinibacter tainanensis TaxID=230667 RepID=UPI00041FCB71|nr:DEAD/DEAH box helicase family protein [Chitinibacter tainanensis]